jgi:hypothetical protein
MGTGGEVEHMKGKLENPKQITPKTAQLLSIFTPLLFFLVPCSCKWVFWFTTTNRGSHVKCSVLKIKIHQRQSIQRPSIQIMRKIFF